MDLHDYENGMKSYFMVEEGKKSLDGLNENLDKELHFIQEGKEYISKEKNAYGNPYKLTSDWETYMRVTSYDGREGKEQRIMAVCVTRDETTGGEIETCHIGFENFENKDDFEKGPTITLSEDGNNINAETHSTSVHVESEKVIKSIFYVWTDSAETPTEGWQNMNNDQTVTSPKDYSKNFYLHIKATDTNRVSSYYDSKMFNTKDTTKPIVTLSKNSSTVTQRMDDVKVTVTDSESGVDKVSYGWHWSNTSKPLFTKMTNNSIVPLSTRTESTLYLFIRATDKAGNVTDYVSDAFQQDKKSPSVSLSLNGNSTYAASYSTVLTVTDEGVGVSSVKYLWSTSNTKQTNISSSTNSGATLKTPTNTMDKVYLHILATDKNGNETYYISNYFNLCPFIYSISGGVATITGYQGQTRINLKIPSKLGGADVTKIGSYAFEKKILTGVTLPNTLEEVGEYAFKGNNLTSLTIPGSMTTVKESAFEDAGILTLQTIIINEGVKYIEKKAFDSNYASTIRLPSSLVYIKYNAFHKRNDTGLQVYLYNGVTLYNHLGNSTKDLYNHKDWVFDPSAHINYIK